MLLWHLPRRWKEFFCKTNKQHRTWAKALIWNLCIFHQTQLERNYTWFETFNCSCCFSPQIRKCWLSADRLSMPVNRFFSRLGRTNCCLFDSVPFWNWRLPQGRERRHSGHACGFGDWGNPQRWPQASLIIPWLQQAMERGHFPASDLCLWLKFGVLGLLLCIIYHFWPITAPLSSNNQTRSLWFCFNVVFGIVFHCLSTSVYKTGVY